EDRQKQHVPEDVQEAAVQEHRAERGDPGGRLRPRVAADARLALTGDGRDEPFGGVLGYEPAVVAGVAELVGDRPPAHSHVVARLREEVASVTDLEQVYD